MPAASFHKQITVLYIHSSSDLYGSDICLLNLVQALPNRVRPIVVLPEEGPLSEKLRSSGIDVRHIPLPVPRRYYFHPRRIHRLGWFFVEMLSSWRKIRRLIRSESVDLVHLNVSILLFPAWIARSCGKPVIIHSREILSPRPWARLVLRMIERAADVLICVSTAAQQQFTDTRKTVVLHDGLAPGDAVESGSGLREEFGILDDALCVGTIGRINQIKGHDIFIRAAHKVIERFPNTRFFIVGDVYKNNVGIRENLKRLAGDLGMAERMVFTGFRSDTDRFFELFDVFVLASRQPESFGMVLLEAMMKSKPVVSTAHGGPLDIVVPGVTGFLVPPEDPDGLADRIGALLADRELREAMGRKGRERVLTEFRQERLIQGLLDIYDRLVGKR
jgi:glycosyltransferase involved in cell wall biosynthesis